MEIEDEVLLCHLAPDMVESQPLILAAVHLRGQVVGEHIARDQGL